LLATLRCMSKPLNERGANHFGSVSKNFFFFLRNSMLLIGSFLAISAGCSKKTHIHST